MDQVVEQKLEDFFKKYKHQQYKKGEMIIRADDNPQGIFYLTKGVVRKYVISRNGEELVLNMFKPISFFPMSWVISDIDNKYFYDAVTAVEVWRAPKDETLQFLKENPDVIFDLLNRIYRGTEGLYTRMAYLMSGNAYTRLITELLIQAKRFGKPDKTGNGYILTVSEKDLATYAGLTRETVSREISNLKDKKLIEYSKNTLKIFDVAALEEQLAGDF